jgi:hypothetical protein
MSLRRAKNVTPSELAGAEGWLRAVALVSLGYDVLLGVSLLFFQDLLVAALELAPPRYPVNGNLNGLFALAVGLGYLAVWRRPVENRWYLWLMGVGLKGAGPLVFLYDVLIRLGPRSFLAFTALDGTLAGLSLFALLRFKAASARAAPAA